MRSTSADVPATASTAREALAAVLARPAYDGAHRISAVGHAHIDSAWLWPVRETVRKVARTVANVVNLLDDEPTTSSTPCRRPSSGSGCDRARARAVRADQGARGGRAVRARRRDVGRVGHQHGRRRGDGAPVPRRPAVVRGAPRDDVRRGVAAGLVRLHRRAAADRHAGRLPVVPHAEDLLEHHQRLPAPHLLVGGHRRHAGVHALPAGRHLHRRADRRASSPTPRATSATRGRRPGRSCRSGTATAAAGRPGRCWPARAHGRRSPARPRSRSRRRRRSSRRPRREYADAPGLGGRAVPGDPPRHLHLAGRDEAGQPPLRAPAARGRAVVGDGGGTRPAGLPGRGAGRALADRAAAPVPRHPSRFVDRVGAPRGAGDVRRGGCPPGGARSVPRSTRWPATGPTRWCSTRGRWRDSVCRPWVGSRLGP